MRRFHRSGALIVVALAVLAWPAAVAQVQVDFIPATLSLNIGESALVVVEVSAVPALGLAAFQLDLNFDSLAVNVLNPNEAFRGSIDAFAPLGNNASCTTVRGTPSCDDPDWFLISSGRTPLGTDTIDDLNGRVQIAYGSFGLGAAPQGSGAIALIEVYGEYNGTTSITFSDLILADDSEPPMEFSTILGSLMVVVGSGIANIPPLLSPVGDAVVFERIALSVPLASSDADGNALTLSVTDLPGFCALNDAGDGSGTLDCAPQVGDAGTYIMTVGATDNGQPNLAHEETITLTVQPTNCVDLDLDGFGAPGDISCPGGTQTDCNDALAPINPASPELCRNGADDDCNSLIDAQESLCAAEVCVRVTLGAPASDPSIVLDIAAQCPVPVSLVRNIDVIWGDLAAVRVDAGDIKVGAITQVACADFNDIQLFDSLRPDAGQVDFFLVRESGQPTYGSSSTALPRAPDSGDCP